MGAGSGVDRETVFDSAASLATQDPPRAKRRYQEPKRSFKTWRWSLFVVLLAVVSSQWRAWMQFPRLNLGSPFRKLIPTSSTSRDVALGSLRSARLGQQVDSVRSGGASVGLLGGKAFFHKSRGGFASESPAPVPTSTTSAAAVASALRTMVNTTSAAMNGSSPPAAADDDGPVPDRLGNFDRIVGPLRLDYANVELAKWQSRETGLTVVWVDMEGARA